MSLLGRALLLLALLAAIYAVAAALMSRQGGRRSLQRSAERAFVCSDTMRWRESSSTDWGSPASRRYDSWAKH